VLEKAKLKGVRDLPEMEDSNGFLNIKSQPLKSGTSSNLNQTQMTIEQNFSALNTPAFKKPSFPSGLGSTFGGFRKKDDKIKTSV
jgi:hypothetical protein